MRILKLSLLFLLLAASAFADREDAMDSYRSGLAEEKRRDFGNAIADFKAAQKKDPDLVAAGKQLANCCYYMATLRKP